MTRIIGLTGGIGSGKSTVARFIASKGIPVYIADEEAKKIMDDEEVIKEISSLFSENVLTEFGKLDRKKIGAIVFKDKNSLEKLNRIIHPKVKEHFIAWLKEHKDYSFIVKEVAILFETGGDKECDQVILITAPEEVKINRVKERDGLSVEEIKKRMKNQFSDEEKAKKSDFVVTNIEINETYDKINEILKILNISQ